AARRASSRRSGADLRRLGGRPLVSPGASSSRRTRPSDALACVLRGPRLADESQEDPTRILRGGAEMAATADERELAAGGRDRRLARERGRTAARRALPTTRRRGRRRRAEQLRAATCDAPAWTFRGRPIPYTRQMDFTQPTDNPAAVIPVERIDGRMLLVCGGKDLVWRSCAYLRAIEARRKRFERASGDVVFAYPQAGHSVGEFLPYIPGAGRLAPADERAREDLWPQVVSFLARG